jgi:UDP-N-acetyl-D-mannosaminuronate dehydrogenase
MTARIAIIGMGHVGKAIHSLLCQHAEIVTYDAAWAVDYPARELAACDAGIICVDTPQATAEPAMPPASVTQSRGSRPAQS